LERLKFISATAGARKTGLTPDDRRAIKAALALIRKLEKAAK